MPRFRRQILRSSVRRRLAPIAALVFALGLLAAPAPQTAVAVDFCFPPSAQNDSYSVLEDSWWTHQTVLDNDGCAPNGINDYLGCGAVCGLDSPSGDFMLFIPLHDWVGTAHYTYQVVNSAQTKSATADVTVTVLPVNDQPGFSVTTGATGMTVAEDSGPGATTGWLSALYPGGGADEAAQSVTVIAVAANPALFSFGPVFGADGHLHFTPAPNANGSTVITYRAHDDGGTANGGIDTGAAYQDTITITPVADAPVGASDQYTVATGSPLSVAAPGVLGNDTDIDGQGLAAALAASAAHGTVSLQSNGAFTYQPAAGYAGLDSFTYRASTEGLTSGLVTVNLTVTAANATPGPTPSPTKTPAPTPTPAPSSPGASVVPLGTPPIASGGPSASPATDASAQPSDTFASASPGTSASAAPSVGGSTGSGGGDLTPIIIAILVAGLLVGGGILGAGYLMRRGGTPGPTPGPPDRN